MPPNFGLGTLLRGRVLGIWGFGHIGQIVASYGRAFGMDVVVWGSEAGRQRAVSQGYVAAPSKQAFFEHCDFVSLHLRLSEATQGAVTLQDLSLMKPTAMLINTSRAELLEADALVCALNRGRPGLAAIDVFESEPILQGHALLRMENCICTPHIGFVEHDTYEYYFDTAFDNVLGYIHGEPRNVANPQALHVRR
jgi:D-3-phosphoglycerate dehydrogenase